MNFDINKVISTIYDSRSIKDARENLLTEFYRGRKLHKNNYTKRVRVALINIPCGGFGDIIFAQKISKYLLEWYGIQAEIFTTYPEAHIKLGENPKNIIKSIGSTERECSSIADANFGKKSDKYFDLYFVAPLQSNFEPEKDQVIENFKYAHGSNIFFFSEYNTSEKNFQFPTGIGGNRYGLLLTKPPRVKKYPGLKNPYSLIYIAPNHQIQGATNCYLSFIEMVCAKNYSKIPKLDIIVPTWIIADLKHGISRLEKVVYPYYSEIIVKTGDDSVQHILEDRSRAKILTIRGDILPVNNIDMISLIKFSQRDILLTGDQSITDALSCCVKKNIFYQIADWKRGFAKELSKELPNKYLKTNRTSCGTLQAIKYSSNYREFISEWDFRILARPKMDAIIRLSVASQRSKKIDSIAVILENSKSIKGVRKSIDNDLLY